MSPCVALRRLVPEDDQARPVRARAADGRERAHARAHRSARAPALRREVRPGELRRPFREYLGSQLVRRGVGEISRRVDPAADARRAARAARRARRRRRCRARSFSTSFRGLSSVFQRAGTVGAEHRAFDDRPCLLVERERERVVQLPGQRAADVGQAARDRRGGGAHRVRVDVVPLPDPCDDNRRALSSPSVCRSTVVPRSPLSSPSSASRRSRPFRRSSSARVPFEVRRRLPRGGMRQSIGLDLRPAA